MIEFGSPGQRCGRGLSGQRRVWRATGTRCGEQCACGVTGLLPGTPVTSPARQHQREPWPGLAGVEGQSRVASRGPQHLSRSGWRGSA